MPRDERNIIRKFVMARENNGNVTSKRVALDESDDTKQQAVMMKLV